MYYKQFHGESISALGFGLLHLPTLSGDPNEIDREKAAALIDAAIRGGVNYFDTAYTYQNGDSERCAGDILSQYPRESYYLASKFYVAKGKPIEEVFEEQLQRCKTDYFDFYLLHGVQEQFIDSYLDPAKDYIGFLERQRELGRIRYIGFSSHCGPAGLRRFLDHYDSYDMALIQLNYVDWTMLQAKEQYEILTQRGIPVWVMEPLKGGRLAELDEASRQILREAAPSLSVASWGFRFLQGLPNVQTVLSGMGDLGQVEDNLNTFQQPHPLSKEEAAVLEEARKTFMDKLGVPCSSCRYCCDSCPAKLDIPLLIRRYNERKTVGETWRVGSESGQAGDPSDCVQCGACAKKCPQKIDIPGVMRALRGD